MICSSDDRQERTMEDIVVLENHDIYHLDWQTRRCCVVAFVITSGVSFFLSLNATWLLGVMARLISTGTWTKKVFGRGNGPFRPLDWHLSCAPSTWVTFCSDLFLSFWLIGASATGTSRKQRERHLRVPAEAPLQHQPAQSALLRRVLPQVKVSPDHFQLARSKS